MLIAVADAEPPDEYLTWEALLSAIQSACSDDKTVELDLTGSTLALTEESKFDYTDGGEAYKTGAPYIKKLVLPRAATSIKSTFTASLFPSLEAVSGLNVSAIPNNAFYTIPTLATVVFPAAKSIGNTAFLYCTTLTSVSLPAAETIGVQAFYGCTTLVSVSLPAAKTIGGYAFFECGALTKVNLTAVKAIEDETFYDCNVLTTITIGEDCDMKDSCIRGGFKTYYTTTKTKAAGVYTYNTGKSSWDYAPLEEEPTE
jgi:hypothetical protein